MWAVWFHGKKMKSESFQMKEVWEKTGKQEPMWCGCSWDGTASHAPSQRSPAVFSHVLPLQGSNSAEEDFPGWASCYTSTGLWCHQHPEATSALFWTRTETQQKRCCFSSTHDSSQEGDNEAGVHNQKLTACINHPTLWVFSHQILCQKSAILRFFMMSSTHLPNSCYTSA